MFALTLGAYWPIRLYVLYEELARRTPEATRLTAARRGRCLRSCRSSTWSRRRTLRSTSPAVSAAYRRATPRCSPSCSCCPWPAASGWRSCSASRCRWCCCSAGYFAWIFNLPAALVLERVLPAARPRETAVAIGAAVVVLAAAGIVLVSAGDDEQDTPRAATQPVAEVSDIAVDPGGAMGHQHRARDRAEARPAHAQAARSPDPGRSPAARHRGRCRRRVGRQLPERYRAQDRPGLEPAHRSDPHGSRPLRHRRRRVARSGSATRSSAR